MFTFEKAAIKFSKSPAFLKIMFGGVKLAFRVSSLPVLRKISTWVDPRKNTNGNLPINVEIKHENFPLPEEIVH